MEVVIQPKIQVCFGSIKTNLGLDIRTTPPYSPESNAISEAFVKTFKRDYVWVSGIENAQVVLKQLVSWFEDYNEKAPHKALLSPREYIKTKTKLLNGPVLLGPLQTQRCLN